MNFIPPSSKQVHWDSTVRIAHLPEQERPRGQSNVGQASSRGGRSSSSIPPTIPLRPDSYPAAPSLPTVDLPPVKLSPLITPGSKMLLRLDLSLPNADFGRQIVDYRNYSACVPDIKWSSVRNELTVIVVADQSGEAFKLKPITVKFRAGDPDSVTIGRILGDVQASLREHYTGTPAKSVVEIARKRADTLPGATSGQRNRERPVRQVDFLLGHTLFGGFTILEGGQWQLRIRNNRTCQ